MSDIYSGVVCERVKFADDGTLWACGSDTEELADLILNLIESVSEGFPSYLLMNRDLQNISRWPSQGGTSILVLHGCSFIYLFVVC